MTHKQGKRTMQLKNFQQTVVDNLRTFLNTCRQNPSRNGIEEAYQSIAQTYMKDSEIREGRIPEYKAIQELPTVPYVCVRIPTGGGKTLLSAYSIEIAKTEFLEPLYSVRFPIVVWLAPSDAIVQQTIKALSNKNHPYREYINNAFNSRISVYSNKEALQLRTADVFNEVVIIVSTMATWRAQNKEDRKVYENNDNFESLLSRIDEEEKKRLIALDNDGRLVRSLANALNVYRPLMIIDEAHNFKTGLSRDVITRLNPSCILEFTATPQSQGELRSNVLIKISANELKKEGVIKLPIELECIDDWRSVVSEAVRQQQKLETIAKHHQEENNEYIRPIVLFQAQNLQEGKDTISEEDIKKHLLVVHKDIITEEQIAIHTGETRELTDVDLLKPNSQIRYIITKQALKEGWDCPFAYIFCSVAKINSAKDAEQLLGRVLRMPNVEKKPYEELNKAYAFVSEADSLKTAQTLEIVLSRAGFDLENSPPLIQTKSKQGEIQEFFGNPFAELSERPALEKLSGELQNKIEIVQEDKKEPPTIIVKELLTESETQQILETIPKEEDRKIFSELVVRKNHQQKYASSPVNQGKQFPLPQLLLKLDDEEVPFDEDIFLSVEWKLSEQDTTLSDFSSQSIIVSSLTVDVDEKGRLKTRNFIEKISRQSDFFVQLDAIGSKEELINYLIRANNRYDVKYSELRLYIAKTVEQLERNGEKIQDLLINRTRLVKRIQDKIQSLINKEKEKSFSFYLSDEMKLKFKVADNLYFEKSYSPTETYKGTYDFGKHYYPLIHKMDNDEIECAMKLDSNDNVEMWLRNIERQSDTSFWLQTSTDRFYPDFLAKLKVGRIAAIEYKNTRDYTNEDSDEKRRIGEYWERVGRGKVLFYMTNGKNWDGLKNKINL
jgi:type III restriction enzyme